MTALIQLLDNDAVVAANEPPCWGDPGFYMCERTVAS